MGALNDNVFKLLVIYFLIHVKGPEQANKILSLASGIFVIPFLLFSSGSGVLADRISKRTIIIFAKILENLITLFGLFAVYFQSEVGLYVALFWMATHSALFAPSKYGIILELVDPKLVSKANGLITSFTYLAIILGTFLASFLLDITGKNFFFAYFACLLIAFFGLISSLFIEKTAPQNSNKKINPFFLYEIYQTVRFAWEIPALLISIASSTFFLFIGAFTQLNIIPFTLQTLNLPELQGGYLFLSMAVGIALGAVTAGKISKESVEPGISCISGLFVGLLFILIHWFGSSFIGAFFLLGALGFFGGAFLVPFDSFIQLKSPDERRGQIVAVNNFFSFVGVLFAALWLFIFNEELGFSASSGFFIMGILTLVIDLFLTGRLSQFFLPFVAKKVLPPLRTLNLTSQTPPSSSILVLQSKSWLDAVLLFGSFPNLKLLIPSKPFRKFPFFNKWFVSIDLIPEEFNSSNAFKDLYDKVQKYIEANKQVCIFFHTKDSSSTLPFLQVIGKMNIPIAIAHGKKEVYRKSFLGIPYLRKQISMHFENGNF
jgi:acyl-[acyl-carrier-protein]-phospholipid O-acyltransferase/long-chain-fatty-acid--[acyl-carrier-protein] ligase